MRRAKDLMYGKLETEFENVKINDCFDQVNLKWCEVEMTFRGKLVFSKNYFSIYIVHIVAKIGQKKYMDFFLKLYNRRI